ncbi:MAG: PD40 domain-containing protein [Bdellovibrionales bacterium]|nr:PD40 domain-containing protein [Bdellovibrionales bacterium]
MDLNGKIVFSSGRAVDFDLWTLDLSSGVITQLTRGSNLYDEPCWSPDGSNVAAICTGKDSIPSLVVMNADGSGEHQLTHGIFAQHPTWSPCGKYLAFTGNATNPNELDIYRCEVSTGQVEKLLAREGIEREPHFSPDGKKLLFASIQHNSTDPASQGSTNIWEYDLESKSERALCSHPAHDYCPRYSPDGTQIAFVSHRNSRTEEEYLHQLSAISNELKTSDLEEIDDAIRKILALQMDSDIYIMNSDGSNLRQLTKNEGCDVGICWSPDGKYLCYSSSVPGDSAQERLSVVSVSTGEEHHLSYDRTLLQSEIGADEKNYLNQAWFQHLVPDFIERRFVDPSFWGEERRPNWKA